MKKAPKNLTYTKFASWWRKNATKQPQTHKEKVQAISKAWKEYKERNLGNTPLPVNSDDNSAKNEPVLSPSLADTSSSDAEPKRDEDTAQEFSFETVEQEQAQVTAFVEEENLEDEQEKDHIVEKPVDEEGYKRVANSMIEGVVQFFLGATDGNVKIDAKDQKNLESSGSALLQKYDAKQILGKFWAEICFTWSFCIVTVKTWHRYKQYKKQQAKEIPKKEPKKPAPAQEESAESAEEVIELQRGGRQSP